LSERQETKSGRSFWHKEKQMQLVLWVVEGLAAGWITGKVLSGIGRDLMLDSVMGMAGAIAGGFFMNAFGFFGPGQMIYSNLTAILGAIVFTVAARLISGKHESRATA
jgi:uncharacterized membrane protein YeaQ/YmgE (transglycosylase-associated protein family)